MGELAQKMKKILLLSYPRSGSNLVAYILQAAFGMEVRGTNENMQVKCKPEQIINSKNCIAFKTHGHLNDLDINNYDALIFCIRDFKKCIVNHYRNDKDLTLLTNQTKGLSAFENGGNPDYLYLLNYYDLWSKDKILITYEKLTLAPNCIIYKLSNFLKAYCDYDKDVLFKFYTDIDFHLQFSLDMYKKADHPDYSELNKKFNLDDTQNEQFKNHLIKNDTNDLLLKYSLHYV